jgi:O-antigen/teichoic acid export membrane protein
VQAPHPDRFRLGSTHLIATNTRRGVAGSSDRILGKGNIITLSTSLAIQACGLITGVLTARLLGPAARGELAAVMLWPVILSNLGLMGCNWALAREVAANPHREADWVYSSLIVAGAAASLSVALGYFLVPHLLPFDKQYLTTLARLCLLLIPLDILSQTLLAAEQGRMRWTRYNAVRAAFYIFYAFLIVLIWASKKQQVLWFVVAFLASHLLAVVVRLWIQWKSFLVGRAHLAECFALLRSGVPFFFATASNLLSLQLDKILVVGVMRSEAVGLYAAAATFSSASSALSEALGITSFAVLANEKSTEKQGVILSQTFRQATLASVVVGVPLACLMPILVVLLFGSAFSQAVNPAVVLTLGVSLGTSSNILNQGLRGLGRPIPGVLCQLFGTGIMALTAVVLSPRIGLMGMAWAVLAGTCCQVLGTVASAAFVLRVSPSCFWMLRTRDINVFVQRIGELSRSPISQ